MHGLIRKGVGKERRIAAGPGADTCGGRWFFPDSGVPGFLPDLWRRHGVILADILADEKRWRRVGNSVTVL